MSVCLIHYPGLGEPVVPFQMGEPRTDQMQGIWSEQLIELAGRVCYDSLGQGRSSVEYHKHLCSVGHTSVHQHIVFTTAPTDLAIEASLPGVTIHMGRVTANLRTAIEIDRYTQDQAVVQKYQEVCRQLLPTVFGVSDGSVKLLKAVYPEEKYISFWISGSRGFSHEQVRHHYQCAVSQRSTRYCDESVSSYIYHPALGDLSALLGAKITSHEAQGQRLYAVVVDDLLAKGVSLKQARGAARGILGNALETQMIFTASLPQWKRMIRQRMSNAADAEIRMIYNVIVERLTVHGLMRPPAMEKAEDGIGFVLAELHVYAVHTRKGTITVMSADADRAVLVAGVKACDVISVTEQV